MNGTETIVDAGPYSYTSPMTATLIGYARCSTDRQYLAAQRQALLELGVAKDRIYTDHRLTGTNRACPGPRRRAPGRHSGRAQTRPPRRSVPDARAIADQLQERGVKLALGRALYNPDDPMGKMFFNILATFAEFEADLIRMHATGEYSISDLAEIFSVSRPTVYRTLKRCHSP